MPGRQLLVAVGLATVLGTLAYVSSFLLLGYALLTFDPNIGAKIDELANKCLDCPKEDRTWLEDFLHYFLISLIVNFGRYWWYVWLERMLPTRPRPKSSTAHQSSKSRDKAVEEEKIIQDWIAQGCIRRSSANYYNIVVKFLLDITVGNFAQAVVWNTISSILRGEMKELSFSGIVASARVSAGLRLLTLFPLVSLLAFVIAPAHQRIVWEDAIFLGAKVTFALTLAKLGPWIMSKGWFREGYEKGYNYVVSQWDLTAKLDES